MINILLKNKLFNNISQNDIESILKCLKAYKKDYEKGDFIFLAGESISSIGVLLSGKAQIIKENVLGDSMIIRNVDKGDMFGETFALMGNSPIPISVVALENSTVLFLDAFHILNSCKSSCIFHHKLISNLLNIILKNNIMLTKKMSYITHKTIRGRLEAYLLDQIEINNSFEFTIPFNKTQLSDYLCIDRSAMSRELTKMKKDKIIDYNGNKFRWLKLAKH